MSVAGPQCMGLGSIGAIPQAGGADTSQLDLARQFTRLLLLYQKSRLVAAGPGCLESSVFCRMAVRRDWGLKAGPARAVRLPELGSRS